MATGATLTPHINSFVASLVNVGHVIIAVTRKIFRYGHPRFVGKLHGDIKCITYPIDFELFEVRCEIG